MNDTVRTYTLVEDAPPPLDWDTYASRATAELSQFLNGGECGESTYQRFFEANPSLLPWIYGTFGQGHHGLIHSTVVSQPRLSGLYSRQPDFLMLARDSASVYAVLVEIESPCKRWFTQAGQPAADLTQAINQLREWKAWFDRPGNIERFNDEFRIPSDYTARRRFEQRYLLIYGRRSELVERGAAGMRSRHQQPDERFMSYDHLEPNHKLRDVISSTVNGHGYSALSIPATLRLGPTQANNLAAIQGKEDALAKSLQVPRERAAFLMKRFAYWDAWARRGDQGILGFEVE